MPRSNHRIFAFLCLASFRVLAFFGADAQPVDSSHGIVPQFHSQGRIHIRPVFFLPRDATISTTELDSAISLLESHLVLAQAQYKSLLNVSTFAVVDMKSVEITYRSDHDDAYFMNAPDNDSEDRAHRIIKELFQWNKDSRYESDLIYLTIYVRPAVAHHRQDTKLLGGGRTFNGPPNSGGGFVEMDYSSLMHDLPYPFQSTVVHELGHAFGLAHVDCLGYDMSSNGSIMSYNPRHHSKGLSLSDVPGNLNAEEYFILSLNKRAFPEFTYKEQVHNPDRKQFDLDQIQQAFLGSMGESIGPYRQFSGVGYELFYDGKKVNGPEAALYSFRQAMDNCVWNASHNNGTLKEYRYNGVIFHPK